MFDVGQTLQAAFERAPQALALVDGDLRLSYAALMDRARRLLAGLQSLNLQAGDRVAVALQNRAPMVVTYWACQLGGLVFTPINWRSKADEIRYYLTDSEAKALIYGEESRDAAQASGIDILALDVDGAQFQRLGEHEPAMAVPGALADDVSLMLYTSGTTGNGKGVPRRHRAERAAALAHVAQNQYAGGERTLGVMPLYHTMGIRSLLAMTVLNGVFVCMPRFDAAQALRLIAAETLTALYLVPTLYHDILAHADFAATDISSVRKLGFAGASMTDGLLRKLNDAFRPDLFVNHYGSSEIYTFTIHPDAPSKPGSAGKAGLNQIIRVLRLGAVSPDDLVETGQEGQIAASLDGDEAFEGYWRRPDADAKSLMGRWYLTGDIGYQDSDGDLFVTGRVDDMIITGGENVLPVEIESLLSLHPAVSEVAVAGCQDERWGQAVTAFIVRKGPVSEAELDSYLRQTGLANFKRPRTYVFVERLPKSPVGKILRRFLVKGEYQPEDRAKA